MGRQLFTQPLGVLLQQFAIRQQGATVQAGQGAFEQRRGLALATGAQQAHELQPSPQRHMHDPLPFGFFQQGTQARLGLRDLALGTGQRGRLLLDAQRQQRMEFGRGGGAFTGIGFRQTRQPGLGQLQLPLGQPELALGEGDHRQVVDRRHVPDVHQPLGLGQLREGGGEATLAAFQCGQGAVSDQQADVAAGAGFGYAGLQADPRGLVLQAHAQQEALVEHQARPGHAGPRHFHATQTLQALLHLCLGAQGFTTRLQDAGTVIMDQGFEQRVGPALRHLQGLAVQVAGAPEVAAHQGEVPQQGKAQVTLAIVLRRQRGQRLSAEMLGALDIAAPPGDQATDGLPLRQQAVLLRGVWRRQEARQVAGQLFRRVQLAGQAEGQAIEHAQPGRAGQQAVGQVHLPAQ
ncbi:hypothetical protein D9M71_189830 [compost metagenome]